MKAGTKSKRSTARRETTDPRRIFNMLTSGAARPRTSNNWNVAINSVTRSSPVMLGFHLLTTPGKTVKVTANTKQTVRACGHAFCRKIVTELLLRKSCGVLATLRTEVPAGLDAIRPPGPPNGGDEPARPRALRVVAGGRAGDGGQGGGGERSAETVLRLKLRPPCNCGDWDAEGNLSVASVNCCTCGFRLTPMQKNGTPSSTKAAESIKLAARNLVSLSVNFHMHATTAEMTPATPWPVIAACVRRGEMAPAMPNMALWNIAAEAPTKEANARATAKPSSSPSS
mmetsp:Transcript_66669/g.168102  ORF Transcript_66669/g.168102 Transcript_66669/m.168102 type:complete len:285 (-) Transcript_66669:437-1291(-)